MQTVYNVCVCCLLTTRARKTVVVTGSFMCGGWMVSSQFPELLTQFVNMLGGRYSAENAHLFGGNEVSSVNEDGGMVLAQADALDKLAFKMNVDPAVFAATVELYAGFVDAGEGRVMDGPTRIETAPFFALFEVGGAV